MSSKTYNKLTLAEAELVHQYLRQNTQELSELSTWEDIGRAVSAKTGIQITGAGVKYRVEQLNIPLRPGRAKSVEDRLTAIEDRLLEIVTLLSTKK